MTAAIWIFGLLTIALGCTCLYLRGPAGRTEGDFFGFPLGLFVVVLATLGCGVVWIGLVGVKLLK